MARVTRHQRPHVGAVGSTGTGKASLRTSSSAAAVTHGGPAARDAQPEKAHPVDDRHRQAEPTGPPLEGAERDEQSGRDHLPHDVLEGQLAGDPAGREAQDGEGLPPDRAVGQRHRDGPDEGDDQEGVGHPSILTRTGCPRRSALVGGGSRLPPSGVGARLCRASDDQGESMTPERLTGLDASFLYMETPTLHMHVAITAVFDPATVPGGYSFRRIRQLISDRIPLAPGLPAPTRRGPDAPRAPGLGGRPRVRHRQPPASCRAPLARRHARARRLHGRRHQPSAPPRPALVGDVDRRGAGGREDRPGGQDAPQHHRRRVGRRAPRRPLRSGARAPGVGAAHAAPARLAYPFGVRAGLPGDGGEPDGALRRRADDAADARAASSGSAGSARARPRRRRCR